MARKLLSPVADDLRPWSVYRRLLGYSLVHWRVMIVAVLFTAVFAVVDASFAALVKPLLDEAFVAKDEAFIRWMPVMIIALFLFAASRHLPPLMAWRGWRAASSWPCAASFMAICCGCR